MLSKLYGKLHKKVISWLIHEPRPSDIPPCDFDRLKYEIRPCDVLLIEGRSRISRIIRTVIQSPWTHAALYIGRMNDIEDEELQKILREYGVEKENSRLVIEGLMDKGTVVTPLISYRHHHIRICRPIGLSAADAQLIVTYAIKSLGGRYNVRQLLDLGRFFLPWSILPRKWGSILFRTPTGEPESGVCSSLIAEALARCNSLCCLSWSPMRKLGLSSRNAILIYSPLRILTILLILKLINIRCLVPKKPLPYYRRLPWTKDNVLYQDYFGKYMTVRRQAEKS